MRAKNPTASRISIARQIHVLRVRSEEQDAWDTSLVRAGPIRAIRTSAPETRRSGSSAIEISEWHASRMPSSAREVVLPPADAAAVLGLGFLIKAAELSTTNSR
jgi:hypothetical protein